MSHSISFTRAQGIPKYKIGFGRGLCSLQGRGVCRRVLCGLLEITQPGSSLSCLVMACCGMHSVTDGAHGAGGAQQSLCCGSLHGCGDRPGTRGLPAHCRAAVPGAGQGRLPTLSINQSIATQHSMPHPATGSVLSCTSLVDPLLPFNRAPLLLFGAAMVAVAVGSRATPGRV